MIVEEYDAFVEEFESRRVVYLSVPAGEIVDGVLDELTPRLDDSDVVMDGGNSFWRDSMRREERMWEHGLYFLNYRTSGGIPGAHHGACFMVGGRDEGIEKAAPILK